MESHRYGVPKVKAYVVLYSKQGRFQPCELDLYVRVVSPILRMQTNENPKFNFDDLLDSLCPEKVRGVVASSV